MTDLWVCYFAVSVPNKIIWKCKKYSVHWNWTEGPGRTINRSPGTGCEVVREQVTITKHKPPNMTAFVFTLAFIAVNFLVGLCHLLCQWRMFLLRRHYSGEGCFTTIGEILWWMYATCFCCGSKQQAPSFGVIICNTNYKIIPTNPLPHEIHFESSTTTVKQPNDNYFFLAVWKLN